MANTEEFKAASAVDQTNPNAGPMRVDGEIIFRHEWSQMVQKLPFRTDSYKVSMDAQYPPEVETVYSYVEARGSRDPHQEHVMMMGSQPMVEWIAEGVNMRDINLARDYWMAHCGSFPYDMWKTVVNDYGGRIPLLIRAVPEGVILPVRNVLATVQNIGGKQTRGLTTWFETTYLSSIWYMSSVATESWYIKQDICHFYDISVDGGREDPSLMFRLHDFGMRGVAPGASGAGGASHMPNFMGTDTFDAITFSVKNYGANPAGVGFSIPAMEHSTVTSWGREREDDAFLNMIETYAGEGKLFAAVIDSYDAIDATRRITDPNGKMCQRLKEKGGLMVLRPDSGDPEAIIPQMLQIIAKHVGYVTNKKGYKILNHFRIIWGDGINRRVIRNILGKVVSVMGFSAENFAFGMGGALLQVTDRDKFQFAMKCSAVQLNDGTWRNVYKQPAGMMSKNSKMGLVETFSDPESNLYVRDIRDEASIEKLKLRSMLQDVFVGGSVLQKWAMDEVRANTSRGAWYNAAEGHSAGVYAPMV